MARRRVRLTFSPRLVTEQRFEIGSLRPPMAEIERVQHLADQMGILGVIVERLRPGQNAAGTD